MKINKSAETFAGIIIGVFILTIILLWIWNLMTYSYGMLWSFKEANNINVLKNNLVNVVKNIDTGHIQENEIFYIYKNNTLWDFQAFTGAVNVEYKYVDKYGEKVDDITTFSKPIYSRVLWKERSDTSLQSDTEIIRVYIKKLVKKQW